MKKNILAIFLLLLAYASAQPQGKLAEDIIFKGKKCFNEASLSSDFGDMIQSFKFKDEEPVRDYFKCLTRKLDFWNPDGETINVENVVKNYSFDLKKSAVRDIVNKCVKSQVATDWIVPFYQCLADSKLGSRVKHAQYMDELWIFSFGFVRFMVFK